MMTMMTTGFNVRQGIRSWELGVGNSELGIRSWEFGVLAARDATLRSYNFSPEIIGNASIFQVMNYENSSFIELTWI